MTILRTIINLIIKVVNGFPSQSNATKYAYMCLKAHITNNLWFYKYCISYIGQLRDQG